MKRNFFTAALESEVQGTVGVADVITEQQDFQPKPGVGEEKGGEASLDDVKPKKEFGEDSEFADHDDIDTVAESQESTLALEHLHASIVRFTRFANALENLVDQVEERVEAGNPLEASETAMLTTAIDAAGIGEPLAESVALESFEFSAQVATESFVETLKARSAKIVDAIAKFSKRIGDELKIRYSTIAATLKTYPDKRIAPLRKKIAAVEGFAGRNFEDAKREKNIQGKIIAPSSSKNPLAALKDSLAAYDAAASMIDTRVTTAHAQAVRAYSTEGADKLPAALNKLLQSIAELTKKHSLDSRFTTIAVEVEVKTLTPENIAGLSYDKFRRKPVEGSFDNSLKIASVADLNELSTLTAKATRVFAAKVDQTLEMIGKMLNSKSTGKAIVLDAEGTRRPIRGENAWDETKLMAAYRYTMYASAYAASSVELGLAEAVLRNALAAADWIGASIAEANAMRKAAA